MPIQNSSDIEKIFGRWPSFHDAEVLQVTLDRLGANGPIMEAVIHVYEATNELDAQGYYTTKSHVDVTLTFTRLELVRLEGFNHQNVLMSLEITEIDPIQHEGRQCHVTMPSIYGLDTEFYCESVIVSKIQPHVTSI
jgi:hypothetical protein